MIKVLSLGAGVQSTTLALMAASGELGEIPDCAIFADTGDEPAEVYRHLEYLMSGVLPFPVYIAHRGKISEALLNGDKAARPPLFFHKNGKIGMMGRQCTTNFKISPIKKQIRKILGYGSRSRIPNDAAEVWIGISMDEIFRMRPSRVQYIKNRHPLIEKQMTRRDCLQWLAANNHPTPPKSSCWHCPYQSNNQWREKKINQPVEWNLAVEFDEKMRSIDMVKLNGIAGYLHPSAIPLSEVDLSTDQDRGQLDLFNNECEGMCGV